MVWAGWFNLVSAGFGSFRFVLAGLSWFRLVLAGFGLFRLALAVTADPGIMTARPRIKGPRRPQSD